MNRFLLAPLLLSFISPVKANLDTEIGRQYSKELTRLVAGVIEAAKYRDRERVCLLVPQAQSNLDNGWSYHREAGNSYEFLVETRKMMKVTYQKFCS